ncbi:MAG: M15 family metallopeptidase [Dysgonamonadaceae bacterium]|nr:M15 family metallopeptidase [Dysgonamonadaceae bacterium]
MEKRLASLGLVDIQSIDTTILVELKYATTDNFTGKILYNDLKKAYLQPDVANMLAAAQTYLKKEFPHLSLLVYDAARPLSVQQEMYECVKGTLKHRYVAPPEKTGLHNYGAAVDLTVIDIHSGTLLDMGTPFDFFGRKAGISEESALIQEGQLTQQQVNNRKLLRNVMRKAGFQTIRGEWWHFNACSLQRAKEKYELIR